MAIEMLVVFLLAKKVKFVYLVTKKFLIYRVIKLQRWCYGYSFWLKAFYQFVLKLVVISIGCFRKSSEKNCDITTEKKLVFENFKAAIFRF
jgi:hypothetical protein